jgi:UDP-N-acetylglucosamine/UDP-N-acetylgalactosamine diphosphorylase
MTHEPTVEYFASEDHFGIPPDRIEFMQQGMMPAVDPEGKLLLAEKGRLFLSPNGHGGCLLALRDSGALDRMRELGVEKIYYFQVDNPMLPIPDPVMLGYHEREGAEMSSKVVEKVDPSEKVGVMAEMDGRTRVVEYSDLDSEKMHARGPDGKLRFRAGSIAVHVLDRRFVERETEGELRLPYHRARKAIPHVDERGHLVEPEEKNGIKFETFIFDALPLARSTMTQEVDRSREFAPVKNAEGVDSPRTARQALVNLYGRWLREAGIEVPGDGEGNVEGRLEISPLFALDARECAAKLRGSGLRFRDGLVIPEEGI